MNKLTNICSGLQRIECTHLVVGLGGGGQREQGSKGEARPSRRWRPHRRGAELALAHILRALPTPSAILRVGLRPVQIGSQHRRGWPCAQDRPPTPLGAAVRTLEPRRHLRPLCAGGSGEAQNRCCCRIHRPVPGGSPMLVREIQMQMWGEQGGRGDGDGCTATARGLRRHASSPAIY